jgi:sugar fermentation stimulation protein A
MRFEGKLARGRLVRRRMRFLAEVVLDTGEEVTAHVPNTGSMRSTNAPGSEVALSHHPDPKRKLEWTLELVRAGRCWVGVNTARPNRIVEEAIAAGRIGPLRGYPTIRREVKYGERSRVDLLLEGRKGLCYVEVKNVTYREGRRGLFPDAVTERGKRHLRELREMVRAGHRAVIFFLVNRDDCASFGPAREIDPRYGEVLDEVVGEGVEPLAYRVKNTLRQSVFDRKLKVVL